MKLLVVERKIFESESSASANRKRSLIEGLERLGIEIHFFYEENSKTCLQGFLNSIFPQVISSKLLSLFALFLDWKGTYSGKNDLFKYLDKLNPDILWVRNDYDLMKCLVSKGDLRNSTLFTELSEFLDIHRVQTTNPVRVWLQDRAQNYFERVFIQKLDGLALMTKTLFNHYKTHFNLDIPLLHLPMTVDLGRFNGRFMPLPEFKPPYIAFVGVMNNIKDGVDILIDAFASIEQEFPRHKLYLVGPWQPDTPDHLMQIEQLGLENRIFWMKTYPRHTIPAVLSNADLLVLPRPDSKQAQGGFPTKLGEYLATGNPVCATAVGEIPDYLEDGKSVFFSEPGAVESFANAMRRALSNPTLAKRVGTAGKKVAELEFNAAIQSKLLKNYFEELIESKK